MGPPLIAEGLLGENEFYKTVLLDSGWAIEPHRPSPDDEQVDFVIHLPGQPANLILVQVKTAFQLKRHARTWHLSIRFGVRADRLFTHPRFWYFLGYFDVERRTFHDPLYLVPSGLLSQGATPIGTNELYVTFDASMEDDSADRWVPYRTSTHGIAKRIEQIFADLPAESPAERLTLKRFLAGPAAA